MKKTKVTSEVMKMYESAGLDAKTIYSKSQVLLDSYRSICWSVKRQASYLVEEGCHYGDDYLAALAYLTEFAPDVERERFESRVQHLFKAEEWITLIDLAVDRVRDYYKRGDMYGELLYKGYLTRCTYKVIELTDILNVERSVYYDRRQEAILLFGYALWGTIIPQRQCEMMSYPA